VISTDPIAAARRLAVSAAELAPEAERERRLPRALVDEIAAAGLFRLWTPAVAGGAESEPVVVLQAIEELARGDGAAGWCLAIQVTSGLLGGYLPEAAAREVYGRPNAIAGGVFAPRGRAVAEDGGYRVSGRWPFASGCQHCDWLMGGCTAEGLDMRRAWRLTLVGDRHSFYSRSIGEGRVRAQRSVPGNSTREDLVSPPCAWLPVVPAGLVGTRPER